MRVVLFFAALLITLSCTPRPPVPPVPPGPDAADAGGAGGSGGAGGIDADTDAAQARQPTCADACARLSALHCSEAGTTTAGATCLDVCRNVQSSGVVAWNLSCLSKAKSCAAAEICPNVVR